MKSIVINLGLVFWAYFARKYEVAKLAFDTNDYEAHNYRRYKILQARDVCYGIPPERLMFGKEARDAMKGKRWSDVPEGYAL